jgi:hypothetical protein
MANKNHKKDNTEEPCMAMQASHSDGEHHTVGIWNLDVLIVPDGRAWFAQGLQVDYAAQGDSVDDAKEQFQKGLRATIHHNLRMFGTIENILKVAPNEQWRELWHTAKGQHKVYSQVSFHEIVKDLGVSEDFPFAHINYAEVRLAA